ncbi:hypothetical protein [Nocardioides sp. B-3]|uniref:hypothetical protein n=1 Tax=Nocardioides sp. B-3 TaxID=2895565 RepID=UPI0021523AA6|nr:hypothetical protein [Nocardioides sp. B-3]UUZ59374.1 hypothetical protein LP418_26725 [Nocardioides sp. B-3]
MARGEAHRLVAGHVDDQRALPELREILGAQVGQRRVRVLQGAVDDDVVLREVRRQRDASTIGDDPAVGRVVGVVVELADPHGVDR